VVWNTPQHQTVNNTSPNHRSPPQEAPQPL
jgi:hypothetical protein